MFFMKHHLTNVTSLILHQLGWQYQSQFDTRNKKALLWRSAAKCLLGSFGKKMLSNQNKKTYGTYVKVSQVFWLIDVGQEN